MVEITPDEIEPKQPELFDASKKINDMIDAKEAIGTVRRYEKGDIYLARSADNTLIDEPSNFVLGNESPKPSRHNALCTADMNLGFENEPINGKEGYDVVYRSQTSNKETGKYMTYYYLDLTKRNNKSIPDHNPPYKFTFSNGKEVFFNSERLIVTQDFYRSKGQVGYAVIEGEGYDDQTEPPKKPQEQPYGRLERDDQGKLVRGTKWDTRMLNMDEWKTEEVVAGKAAMDLAADGEASEAEQIEGKISKLLDDTFKIIDNEMRSESDDEAAYEESRLKLEASVRQFEQDQSMVDYVTTTGDPHLLDAICVMYYWADRPVSEYIGRSRKMFGLIQDKVKTDAQNILEYQQNLADHIDNLGDLILDSGDDISLSASVAKEMDQALQLLLQIKEDDLGDWEKEQIEKARSFIQKHSGDTHQGQQNNETKEAILQSVEDYINSHGGIIDNVESLIKAGVLTRDQAKSFKMAAAEGHFKLIGFSNPVPVPLNEYKPYLGLTYELAKKGLISPQLDTDFKADSPAQPYTYALLEKLNDDATFRSALESFSSSYIKKMNKQYDVTDAEKQNDPLYSSAYGVSNLEHAMSANKIIQFGKEQYGFYSLVKFNFSGYENLPEAYQIKLYALAPRLRGSFNGWVDKQSGVNGPMSNSIYDRPDDGEGVTTTFEPAIVAEIEMDGKKELYFLRKGSITVGREEGHGDTGEQSPEELKRTLEQLYELGKKQKEQLPPRFDTREQEDYVEQLKQVVSADNDYAEYDKLVEKAVELLKVFSSPSINEELIRRIVVNEGVNAVGNRQFGEEGSILALQWGGLRGVGSEIFKREGLILGAYSFGETINAYKLQRDDNGVLESIVEKSPVELSRYIEELCGTILTNEYDIKNPNGNNNFRDYFFILGHLRDEKKKQLPDIPERVITWFLIRQHNTDPRSIDHIFWNGNHQGMHEVGFNYPPEDRYEPQYDTDGVLTSVIDKEKNDADKIEYKLLPQKPYEQYSAEEIESVLQYTYNERYNDRYVPHFGLVERDYGGSESDGVKATENFLDGLAQAIYNGPGEIDERLLHHFDLWEQYNTLTQSANDPSSKGRVKRQAKKQLDKFLEQLSSDDKGAIETWSPDNLGKVYAWRYLQKMHEAQKS